MLARDAIGAAIRGATGGGPALVAYLTAGFPSRDRFRSDLTAIASAAEVVEIGVPFTDPMADGATIQRASHAALQQGVSLEWILAELGALKPLPAPVLLMSYLNPLLAYGLARLPDAARSARVAGLIVPDLPDEESGELKAALTDAGLALVSMVTPVTPAARLARIAAAAQGFVYAVTMTGTTGREVAVPPAVLDYLDRVRAAARVPVCAGFGIRNREQVERLRGHADGAVVGSALVEVLERGDDPRAFLKSLRP